jgi:hypothetical protein
LIVRRAKLRFFVALVILLVLLASIAKWQESSDAAKELAVTTAPVKPPDLPRSHVPEAAKSATTDTSTPTAWTLLDALPENAPRKVRDDLPATLLQLDRTLIESLAAGDALLLPISDTTTVSVKIDRAAVNTTYGVTSLRATALVDGARLPTVITFGEHSTLATVGTAEGVFELRGTAKLAWLYRSVDLGLPGGHEVDYVLSAPDLPPR